MAAAPFLPALCERRGFRWTLWGFAFGLGLLLLGLGAGVLLGHARFLDNVLEDRGADAAVHGLGLFLLGTGAIGTLAALVLRPARAVAATATLLFALWCGYGLVVYPLLDGSSSARELMQAARRAAADAVADAHAAFADEFEDFQLREVRREDGNGRAALEALPKDTALAFMCHHGGRSAQAAEQFRALGFTKVFNVTGGINAWSIAVDPKIPRY